MSEVRWAPFGAYFFTRRFVITLVFLEARLSTEIVAGTLAALATVSLPKVCKSRF